MKHLIICISLLFLMLSCNNKNEKQLSSNETKTNDTITIEFYNDKNTQIKEIRLKNGIIKKFYDNGNLFLTGKLNKNDQRIGKWSFYTKEGKLSEIREFYIINKLPYLNQNIYFSKDNEYWTTIKDNHFNAYDQNEFYNDTLNYNKSYYAEFDLGKDTININEPWRAVCYYYTPVFKDKNSEAIVVMGQIDHNFNKDFSNIREVEMDTFYSLEKDFENRRYFPDDDPNYTVVFGSWFKTPGNKIIRGYLSENYQDENNKYQEKRIFFEKNIFVKDSL